MNLCLNIGLVCAVLLALTPMHASVACPTSGEFDRRLQRLLPIQPTQKELAAWHKLKPLELGSKKKLFGTTTHFIPAENPVSSLLPMVGENDSAVLIWKTGYGLLPVAGETFLPDAFELRAHGIGVSSTDYPFIAGGPRDQAYMNTSFYMKKISEEVQAMRATGKRVYIGGYSMGPEVIQELLYLEPNSVDGAIFFAPSSMRYRPDFQAEERAHAVREFPKNKDFLQRLEFIHRTEQQMKSAQPDVDRFVTTVPILSFLGENDATNTAALREDLRRFPNIDVRVVPGGDHHTVTEDFATPILSFIASKEGLPTTGEPLNTGKQQVKYLQSNYSLFKTWLQTVGPNVPTENLERDHAWNLLSQWNHWLKIQLRRNARNKDKLPRHIQSITEKPTSQITDADMRTLSKYLDRSE